MPRKISEFTKKEQPINWGRAFLAGGISATFMAAFIDIFYLMQKTPFSYEYYLGGLILQSPYGAHTWTVGYLANWLVGAVFGIFYGYCFEYVFWRASPRLGVLVGAIHTIVAGIAIFPFFSAIDDFMGTQIYPSFGILGHKLGWETPLLIVLGHLCFGASMGAFYGGVRVERVRARYSELGDLGRPGEPNVPTFEDDPIDRAVV